ncbi:MAG: hypothetical protein DA329_06195 [Candidatus Nitrosocosmicus sp.]|nr:hypothetical protein [Candidatus Nitrosocosmicus sp.]
MVVIIESPMIKPMIIVFIIFSFLYSDCCSIKEFPSLNHLDKSDIKIQKLFENLEINDQTKSILQTRSFEKEGTDINQIAWT